MEVHDRETYESLKLEFNRPNFKKNLKKIKPPICTYCGSMENIEYHHLISLKLGGDNRINNIIPLCNRCHKVFHNGKHLSKYKNTEHMGRPRKATLTQEVEELLWTWANGQIGSRECMDRLGYGKTSKLKDTALYKDFINKNNIENIRNLLDVVRVNGNLVPGVVTSTIFYKDGDREFGYYNPMP